MKLRDAIKKLTDLEKAVGDEIEIISLVLGSGVEETDFVIKLHPTEEVSSEDELRPICTGDIVMCINEDFDRALTNGTRYKVDEVVENFASEPAFRLFGVRGLWCSTRFMRVSP